MAPRFETWPTNSTSRSTAHSLCRFMLCIRAGGDCHSSWSKTWQASEFHNSSHCWWSAHWTCFKGHAGRTKYQDIHAGLNHCSNGAECAPPQICGAPLEEKVREIRAGGCWWEVQLLRTNGENQPRWKIKLFVKASMLIGTQGLHDTPLRPSTNLPHPSFSSRIITGVIVMSWLFSFLWTDFML